MHNTITQTIVRHYGITVADLKRKCRKPKFVEARQVLGYFLRKHTELSLQEIGMLIHRHHATVVHNIKQTEDLLQTDKAFRKRFEELNEEINQVAPSPYITIPKSEYEELKRLAENKKEAD